ncbi:MAG TPA: flagellar motor protein MotB [Gammaproteobacteria bacterium]|nr:flagellar motor protein MotB [Gammaproteobacteria bacterium]
MAVEAPPIIIKKIKKGGHGHHGGAWKVAFADFVTAMMAFFMLMWLLGSTTPEQRAAIAQYMNDPLASNGPGGAGKSPVLDGGDGILDGAGPSAFPNEIPGEQDFEQPGSGAPAKEKAEEIAAAAERERMESLLEELKKAIEAGQALKPFKDQLLLDITNEGLRIQIVDKENRPMFAVGSPVLQDYTRVILRELVKVINQVPNRISISGHTDRTPYASSNGYSNWELSADRANAARRELIAGGMPEEKIGRVVGLSSSVLFDTANPFSPINRRISIIVMNKAAEEAVSEGEGKSGEQEAPAMPVDASLPPPADRAVLDDVHEPAATAAASPAAAAEAAPPAAAAPEQPPSAPAAAAPPLVPAPLPAMPDAHQAADEFSPDFGDL